MECICPESYVTCTYRQYRIYLVIFARKYNIFQKINIAGDKFNSSGTPLITQKKSPSFQNERQILDMNLNSNLGHDLFHGQNFANLTETSSVGLRNLIKTHGRLIERKAVISLSLITLIKI